jgi:hypothetical protein
MTKSNTTARSARSNNGHKGKITKVDGEAASVAPEGGAEIEQPAEVGASDAEAEEQEIPVTDEPAPVTDPEQVDAEANSPDVPADAPEPETAEQPAPIVDPFADLPMLTFGDYEMRDLSAVDKVSDPRKYDGVHRAAREAKAHMKLNWKYANAMITVGTHQKDFKPSSVHGTIDQIVRSYGRAGVPAYILVAKTRQGQIGNKRSHYCTELPPIGWAEGWIDSYISKNHGKVMAKEAPPITMEVIEQIAEENKEALQQAAA